MASSPRTSTDHSIDADNAGVGDDYRAAINEYRGAMQLDKAWQTTKEALSSTAGKIATGLGVGGDYAIAKKYWPW